MKISDSKSPQDVKHTTQKTSIQEKVVKLKEGNRRDVEPLEEKVILSHKAKDIEMIREILRNTPDVREDRIALIKKKIESGEYSVKGKEVADQMLREFLLEDLLKT
jgi:negative regulator of flagellin synthesis FlgM